MSKRALYTPGTDSIDITAPGGIEQLLDFHRATFGDARMEDDPQAPTDPVDEPKLNEHGFPDQTPVKDMPAEQQVAYWKHQARKHEGRVKDMADYDAIRTERDELRAAGQTEAEKAIEAARKEAAETARAEARKETLPGLVKAEFRATVAGRIPADRLANLLEPLDLTKFLTADGGEVDTDKVQQYVDGLSLGGDKKWPDTGQGRREQQKATGVAAGREAFAARRPQPKS